jgi:hypothetical protein
MEYSAVSQPLPEFFRNAGTPSSTVAVQMTFVFPISMRTEPGGYFRKSLTIFNFLISFGLRPLALIIGLAPIFAYFGNLYSQQQTAKTLRSLKNMNAMHQ